MSTWRIQARRCIQAQMRTYSGPWETTAMQAYLRAHYPFGARRGWPYRVWCEERRIAMSRPTYF